MVALIGCYQGYNATGGGRGVGIGTTRAVVIASVTTLVLDYFLTDILLHLMPSTRRRSERRSARARSSALTPPDKPDPRWHIRVRAADEVVRPEPRARQASISTSSAARST